jgi:hypothetical protein
MPDDDRHFGVEIEGLGLTQWALPLPLYAQTWHAAMVNAGIFQIREEMQARAPEDGEWTEEEQKAEVVRLITERADITFDTQLLSGAALGLCWYGAKHDLETRLSDYPDPKWGRDLKAYGESVLLELHGAGWTQKQMAVAWGAVSKRLNESLVDKEDAAAREDFSEARQEGATS